MLARVIPTRVIPARVIPAPVVATVAILLTAAVVGATPASAVANGSLALPGQYPFAVKLTMTGIPRLDGTFYDSACSAARWVRASNAISFTARTVSSARFWLRFWWRWRCLRSSA